MIDQIKGHIITNPHADAQRIGSAFDGAYIASSHTHRQGQGVGRGCQQVREGGQIASKGATDDLATLGQGVQQGHNLSAPSLPVTCLRPFLQLQCPSQQPHLCVQPTLPA